MAAKWPDFLDGILPRMSTVFQMSVLRRGKDGKKNGKTGMLGLDRLKVRWDVALFFLHVIV